jgi:hypothetical protein
LVLTGLGGGLCWYFFQSCAEGIGILFLVLLGIVSLVCISLGVILNFSTTSQHYAQIAESIQRQTQQTKDDYYASNCNEYLLPPIHILPPRLL